MGKFAGVLLVLVLLIPLLLGGIVMAQGDPQPPPGPPGPAAPAALGVDPAVVVVVGALLLLVIVLAIVAVSRGGERPATS
jgi:hypothetical protein